MQYFRLKHIFFLFHELTILTNNLMKQIGLNLLLFYPI